MKGGPVTKELSRNLKARTQLHVCMRSMQVLTHVHAMRKGQLHMYEGQLHNDQGQMRLPWALLCKRYTGWELLHLKTAKDGGKPHILRSAQSSAWHHQVWRSSMQHAMLLWIIACPASRRCYFHTANCVQGEKLQDGSGVQLNSTYLASIKVSSTTRAWGCLGSRTHAQKAVFLSISLTSWPCKDLHHCRLLSTSDSWPIGISKMLHSNLVMSSYFASGLVSRMFND